MTIDPVKGSLANVASGDNVDIYTQLKRDGRTVIQLFRPASSVLQAPGASGGGNVVLKVGTGDAVEHAVRVEPDDALLRRSPGLRRLEDRAVAR